MPPFRKHVDFDILGSVNEAKVAMAEIEVVQSELDSNDTESQEVGRKSPVIRRILLSVD